jgi:hypothetical protein
MDDTVFAGRGKNKIKIPENEMILFGRPLIISALFPLQLTAAK